MIADEKRQIIMEFGVPVDILDINNTIVHSTFALMGKASKQTMTEIALEYHKQGHFVPDITVNNGSVVLNKITNERYLVVANFKEVVEREQITTITRLLECNGAITVSDLVETADDYGNITTTPVTVADNVGVHIQAVGADLKQFDPGKFAKVDYRVFAPLMNVKTLDTITLTINGKAERFKVEYADFISFVGLVLIDVCSETRA